MKQLRKLLVLLPVILVMLMVTNPTYTGGFEENPLNILTMTKYSLCVGVSLLIAAVMTELDVGVLSCICVPCGLVGARVFYCLARYSMFFRADSWMEIFRATNGGYLLYGAVAGAAFGAWIYAKLFHLRTGEVLDALAAPGLMMIALCRFAEFFSYEGRGLQLAEGSLFARLPFALTNSWGEWRVAVFVLEGLAALIIMIIVLLHCEDGKGAFLMALVLYAMCQIVFESMRQDSCPRFGFVRASQVLSGVVLLGVTVYQAWKLPKKSFTALRIIICVVLFALCGIMEWALDKTEMSNILVYAIMSAGALGMAINALIPRTSNRPIQYRKIAS